MTCQQCEEREAVVQLKRVEGGEVRIQHLCERCAAERGVPDGEETAKTPLGAFLAAMGTDLAGESPLTSGAALAECPGCGATLQDFRRTGRLGCATCWSTFEGPLRGLTRRVHGATRHVGEFYVRPGAEPPDQAALVQRLREQLSMAVADENFERAAELRDRLRGLE
ncbi:MAG TPA: UvrB/UvrC motif-containing protein [Gemmatimonadales bacterium]|nr:UvrB/UvrC motif-containing protein [Gemmatimonadales bacterium]